jgi:hypothetical protein
LAIDLPRRAGDIPHMTKPTLLLLAALSCLLACRSNVESDPHRLLATTQGQTWLRTELYFGLDKKDGGQVTDAEFQAFLDTVVTPRFPQGLTVVTAHGQWRQGDALDGEPSRILILLHDGGAESHREIEEIRSQYVRQFEQDAVMRVDSVAKVSF